jgi:crotonobetainyl-CoA:carnitine CoA-transferase CaiB-like acyl-CoA transferase
MLENASANTQTPVPVSEAGPLVGLRVIDLTVALAGPYCTLLLGGLGAEVIKVEAPGGSDLARFNPPYVSENGLNYGDAARPGEVSMSVLGRHRNKKSVTLDIKSKDGRAMFLDLVKQADILVENFSVGTTERLGIDYETLRGINPRLIYTSISAMGKDGPPQLKGMDIIVQALSGVMEVNGFADGPPCRVGFPLGDFMAPHYALSGILSAVIFRSQTGKGQKIEVNLLDSLVCLLALEHFDLQEAQGHPARTGNNQDRLTPFGVYRAKDGRYVAIAAPQDAWAHALYEAMGKPELASDERFSTRGRRSINAKLLNQMIEDWTETLDSDTVVELLGRHGVSAVTVRTPSQALQDPQILARGGVKVLRHPKVPESVHTTVSGVPIQFSECGAGYDKPAPLLGDDNAEVYSRLLNLDNEALDDLRRRGVI